MLKNAQTPVSQNCEVANPGRFRLSGGHWERQIEQSPLDFGHSRIDDLRSGHAEACPTSGMVSHRPRGYWVRQIEPSVTGRGADSQSAVSALMQKRSWDAPEMRAAPHLSRATQPEGTVG
jgi:hypothetical protein